MTSRAFDWSGAPVTKRAGSDKALSCRAKAAAGGGHDVAALQNLGKDVPGGLAREAHPDIGRVLTTIHREAQVLEGAAQDGRVLLVEGHQLVHLFEALILCAAQRICVSLAPHHSLVGC